MDRDVQFMVSICVALIGTNLLQLLRAAGPAEVVNSGAQIVICILIIDVECSANVWDNLEKRHRQSIMRLLLLFSIILMCLWEWMLAKG